MDEILDKTGSERVNIVAHIKGGLDSRWYIADNDNGRVANLIMIATPNSGSPAALWDFSGCPFGSDFDLFHSSNATNVSDKFQSTNYYTIVGNWLPNFVSPIWTYNGGSCLIPGPDDGFVPVGRVNPNHRHIQLGSPFPYYHINLLLQKDVYDRVIPILSQ
jgi:pimeloyl-ACP methyl ester carboxylesterase